MRILMFALLSVSLLLTACAKRGNVRAQKTAATQSVMQRIDVTDKLTRELLLALKDAGIGVINVGQDYKIVIPTKGTYIDKSPRIRWGAYKTLNIVAKYLNQYRLEQLKVVSLVKASGNLSRDKALAKARANKLIDYLWSQSVDASFIYGSGKVFSTAETKFTAGDMRQLSRVELSFRNTII